MVVKIDAEVNYLSTFMRYDMILSSEIDAIQIRTPVKIKEGLESGVWNRESVESGVWSLESGVLSLESGVWSLESGVWSLESADGLVSCVLRKKSGKRSY